MNWLYMQPIEAILRPYDQPEWKRCRPRSLSISKRFLRPLRPLFWPIAAIVDETDEY